MRAAEFLPRMWVPALAAVALLGMGVSAPAQAGSSGHSGGSHGGGGSHSAGGASHGGGGVHRASGAYRGGSAGYYGGARYSSPRAGSYAGSARAGAPGGAQMNASRARGGYGRNYAGRGGYGGYGGYRGYRGYGYGWGGLAYGAFVPFLPAYYLSFWWGGLPYYYADNNYYLWNDGAASYEVVAPPPSDPAEGAGPDVPATSEAPASDLYAYPQQGQSAEQLGKDQYECHRWAADQTGFDPTRPSGGVAPADAAGASGAYRRADAACLAGRGYSVR